MGALGKHGGSSRRRKGENDKNMVYSGMKFSNNNFKGKKTKKKEWNLTLKFKKGS